MIRLAGEESPVRGIILRCSSVAEKLLDENGMVFESLGRIVG